jgi:hypothetical protein
MTITVGQQNNVNFRLTLEPEFNRLLFDKRELKAAIRKSGAVVRAEARRLISSRAVSSTGEFPGYDSGAMSRAIKIKVGSGGGYVRVMPYKTTEMGEGKNDFYPAYLFYGTRRGLQPRKDFMQAALDNKQAEIRAAISASLANSLRAQMR